MPPVPLGIMNGFFLYSVFLPISFAYVILDASISQEKPI